MDTEIKNAFEKAIKFQVESAWIGTVVCVLICAVGYRLWAPFLVVGCVNLVLLWCWTWDFIRFAKKEMKDEN